MKKKIKKLKDTPKKRLYSIKELASGFGGTVHYWRTQIWKHNIPVIQVGRKMLIDILDVEAFIDAHKGPA